MDHIKRREILLKEMERLNSQEISCRSCAGFCCTSDRNSMMITEIEALDIFQYLISESLLNQDLLQKLQDNIKQFRLDQKIGNGKRSFIRRTYTCPFFQDKQLGCSLPKEIKPYGCLAYNPSKQNESQGISCSSHQNNLLEREKSGESYGEKQTIPEAILYLAQTRKS